ncbi:MAG: serpin family protein [Bacteroidales bacterium]|nr:serpin family protein [Bacteroidales bacterium]
MRTLNILIGFFLLFNSHAQAQKSNISDYNNQFAFDFFKKVSGNGTGNVFFSPISISTAMGMTYVGANGETQNQISKVFHFPTNSSKFHRQQGSILKLLSSKADSIKLSMVNTIWLEKTYTIKKAFDKTLKDEYRASLERADFINKYEDSRILINNNISKATSDRIKDLLPINSLNTLTRLVLTNAVYFKANWKTKFQKERTGDAKFYVTPQKSIKCKMIGLKSKFDYFEDDKVQAIELPYSGNNFSMLIILPQQDQNVDVLIKGINQDYLNSIINGLTEQSISISIPKYKLSTGYQLKLVLSDMGMPQPFSDDADFSKMSSGNDLKISNVFHKAFIEVNEEGTEATAATAVVIAMKSIGIERTFIVNRPYVFLIREKTSGLILFMGRINDPTKSE